MRFNNTILKNTSKYIIEGYQGQSICNEINKFFLSEFCGINFDYNLNIIIVSDTTYWGQVKFKNNNIENVQLRIELFKDFLVKDLSDSEKEKIRNARNNTLQHELIHIRNRVQYKLKQMDAPKTDDEIEEMISQIIIDEYLAVYESGIKFKPLEIYTEETFVENCKKILDKDTHVIQKGVEIAYKAATLIAYKHVDKYNKDYELSNEYHQIEFLFKTNISAICNMMIKDMSEVLLTCKEDNLSATSTNLKHSLKYLLHIITHNEI